MNTEIRKVVIAGGGTAGWIAAAGISISQAVARLPKHEEFIEQYCKATSSVWGTPAA